MTDYEPPADLVELQRRFFVLDELCGGLAGGAELEEARAERLRVVVELYAHPWWGQVDNRHEASMAVRRIARG